MKKIIFVCCMFVSLLIAVNASGDTITFNLNYEFSGGQNPSGSPPWATAIFTDVDSDTVKLEMKANLKGSGEFISKWLFNYKDNLTSLDFDFKASQSTGPEAEAVSTGSNSFKADGDGDFDIKFEFPIAASGNRFKDSQHVVYEINLLSGSWSGVHSFDDFSSIGGGQGTYHSAAHVQGIDAPITSGWIGSDTSGGVIPEPATMVFMGAGLLGMAGFLRKKFKK